MTAKAKTLLRMNSDYIGWISIDGTEVDYPILLDPGEIKAGEGYGDEEYEANWFYLDHDFNRESYRAGALFMDYRDIFGSSEEDQSENIVIYGHNMANNTMFGSLRRYRQDLSFIDESPFIDLSSNYEDYQYVIFGLTITSGNWYTDFRYWDMEELDNEEDFNYYVDTIKAGSMVDTGVDVQYGDKLLTLSTCYSDEDNSRFLVVARRLRDDETPNDISSIARTEEYIKAQQGAEADEESEDASGEQQDSESSTDADGSGDNAQ
jgi:sortase B